MPKANKSKKNTRATVLPSEDPLFPARDRNPRIGGNVRPQRELSRFVKWPRNVKIQRQRQILQQRLKVPPSINQFTRALSRDQARELFLLLSKYKPEDKAAKKERLRAAAEVRFPPIPFARLCEAHDPCRLDGDVLRHIPAVYLPPLSLPYFRTRGP
jgi:hypothetical protein